jgi:hypothetical protein
MQICMIALWILCLLSSVAVTHAGDTKEADADESGAVRLDTESPVLFDLDTENFVTYPQIEEQQPVAPVDRRFIRAKKKAATEPAWLQAMRTRNPYMDHFLEASRKYNVPLLLLAAIAEQESGNNPWALNIAGQGHKPVSKKDALRTLRDNYKLSYDVGLMQVNSYWIRRFSLRVEDVFDPPVNITIAAYILDECFHAYGAGWKALGAYHHPPSKNTARSLNYAKVVWARYLKLEAWKNRFKEDS